MATGRISQICSDVFPSYCRLLTRIRESKRPKYLRYVLLAYLMAFAATACVAFRLDRGVGAYALPSMTAFIIESYAVVVAWRRGLGYAAALMLPVLVFPYVPGWTVLASTTLLASVIFDPPNVWWVASIVMFLVLTVFAVALYLRRPRLITAGGKAVLIPLIVGLTLAAGLGGSSEILNENALWGSVSAELIPMVCCFCMSVVMAGGIASYWVRPSMQIPLRLLTIVLTLGGWSLAAGILLGTATAILWSV